MIATSSGYSIAPTGCRCTTVPLYCDRGTSITAAVMNCWNCHYYGPNIQASINYQIEHSAAKAKEKKKSSAQKARDGLKNLPHNGKAMRY
jgi:hypothetical protein